MGFLSYTAGTSHFAPIVLSTEPPGIPAYQLTPNRAYQPRVSVTRACCVVWWKRRRLRRLRNSQGIRRRNPSHPATAVAGRRARAARPRSAAANAPLERTELIWKTATPWRLRADEGWVANQRSIRSYRHWLGWISRG